MVNHEKCIALSPHHWRVYTDGSGINGHVGASATCPQNQFQKQAYLGTEKEFTVPIAELVGLALALEIAKEASDRQFDIFVDSQCTLITLRKPRQASGQDIVRKIIEDLEEMQGRVTFHWIAAHSGIPGNEEADRLAKEATGWRRDGGSGPRAPTYPMKAPASTVSRWVRNKVKSQWKREWPAARHGSTLRQVLPRLDNKSLQLYHGLTKNLSSVLTQMRPGKIRLGAYLHSIRVKEGRTSPATWRDFWRTNGRCGAAPCSWLRLGSYGRPARADSNDPATLEEEPQTPLTSVPTL
jgi:ribonuclease HI